MTASTPDPQRLKPGDLVALVNSTTHGPALTHKDLRLAKQAFPHKVSSDGGRTFDALRYAAFRWQSVLRPGEFDTADLLKQKTQAGQELRIPPCEDPERRAAAVASYECFIETYAKGTFRKSLSPDHKTVIGVFERVRRDGGLFALAMPRGDGKTSMCEWFVLFCVLGGYRRFAVLMGADEEAAGQRLESLRRELLTNELLIADFPEVCVPLLAVEGYPQRKIRYNGRVITQHITGDVIELPDTFGPAAGAVIKITGLLGGFRGLVHKRTDGQQVRPDVVVLDDPQTDRSARSDDACDEREDTINAGVRGLAGPGERLSVVCPCTFIRRGDLTDRLFKNPDWQGMVVPLVRSMPVRLDLWDQWNKVRRDGIQQHDGGAAGNEFYLANRAEMERGGKVSWEERRLAGDVSALQSAMQLYYADAQVFWSEYQQDPRDSRDDGRLFDPVILEQEPDKFRDWLQMPDGRSFGKSLDDWQRADFSALDLAFRGMVNREKVKRRRLYLERPKDHAKTVDAAAVVAWALAFSPRTIRGVVAGADKGAAKRFISALKTMVADNPRLQDRLTVRTTQVTNPTTGSLLEVISSDAVSALDLGQPDFVICDHLAKWRDAKRWTALQSAMGNPFSVLLVTSQAGQLAGMSWQWSDRELARESPDWYFASNQGASWVDPEFIEYQQATLPPKTFNRVYGNVWSGAVDRPLLDELTIGGAIVEGCLWTRGERPAGVNPKNIHIGIDVGITDNRTVVTTLEQVGEQCIVREILVMTRALFKDQRAEITKRLKPGVGSCHIDQGVVGAQLAQELKIAFPVVKALTLNGAVQGMLADRLRVAFTDGKLSIPDDLALITDLGSVEEIGETKGGVPTVNTALSSAGHADRFWSLAMAMHGVPRKRPPTAPAQGIQSRYADRRY